MLCGNNEKNSFGQQFLLKPVNMFFLNTVELLSACLLKICLWYCYHSNYLLPSLSLLFFPFLPQENRAFSHDVTAAILVFQSNETAAMLVYQENPLGVELFSYANAFFYPNKLHRCWPRERKRSVEWNGIDLASRLP